MVFSKLFKSKKQDPPPEAKPQEKEDPQPTVAQPATLFSPDEIKQAVIEILGTVYDPEIPVNIYELGLVYDVDVDQGGTVVIRMTLTSPGCPVAASMPMEVESKVRLIPGVADAKIILVWDPPWDPGMMSEAAKLQLGFL
jgi:FeS assembly SUF system protein